MHGNDEKFQLINIEYCSVTKKKKNYKQNELSLMMIKIIIIISIPLKCLYVCAVFFFLLFRVFVVVIVVVGTDLINNDILIKDSF